jgi:vancomycin resistance protein YoaR
MKIFLEKIINRGKRKTFYKTLSYVGVILLTLAVCFFVFDFVVQKVYEGRFYAGTKIGDFNISKMTYTEAYELLDNKILEIENNGLGFSFENEHISVMPVMISQNDPDIAFEIYNIDFDKTIDMAFGIGRSQGFFENIKNRWNFLFGENVFHPEVYVDKIRLENVLAANFDDRLVRARETYFEIDTSGKIKIIPGEKGEKIDYDFYVDIFSKNISNIHTESISMEKDFYSPNISSQDIENMIPEIETAMSRKDIFFEYPIKKSWMKESEMRKKYLGQNSFLKGLKAKYNFLTGEVYLGFDEVLFLDFVDTFRLEIEIKKKNAKFKITNGRVTEFQSSSAGVKIDDGKSLSFFEKNINNPEIENFEIFVENKEADIKTSDVNDLGIEEVVGVGQSSFAGSPFNRIHNIRTGAEKINGLIIEPGEEFSLIEQLGDINAQTNYLPELVIKGNKTIPEYGGGLCQIATTLFRSVLDAGFEVTERYAHAYRVSYYEPAGTDATIYEPHPDLRFKNNTPGIVLLQTKIEGQGLVFEFWGQDDGRLVEVADPVIYNIVEPGPTKYIETEDLEPGEVDCTESAHNGAEAILRRKVELPDGEKIEDEFYSKYRPWQAVCLVGIDPLESATSTDEVVR